MDSLDELLADLHSATNTMKSEQTLNTSNRSSSSSGSLPTQVYQVKMSPRDKHFTGEGDQYHRSPSPRVHYSNDRLHSPQGHYTSVGIHGGNNSSLSKRDSDRYSADSGASGDGPAPPLPPPPSQDVIDELSSGYREEPLYEPQHIFHTNNNHSSPSSHMGYMEQVEQAPRVHPVGQSTLGANLNELDDLLQDLNSAQFMNDISRSTSDNSMNRSQSPSNRMPPPTLPQPSRSPQFPPQPTPYTGVPTAAFADSGHASSATRELEDLMDSLSQFKIDSSQSVVSTDEPPYAQVDKPASNVTTPVSPTKPSELDNMLGSLESDMRGHGVSVSTKGLCGACAKPVVGQVITALGRIWHPAHFCCDSCRSELGTKSFFERDEKPYCEHCYHRLFAPLCGKCNEHILDKCVTAMDTTWHMECFVCEHCGRMLNDEGFHERAGRPYCRNDYFEMFAPKCGGCEQPIIEDFISTLNTQWHPQCFRCKECGITLAGGSFFDHEGLPYCETHYYAKRGSLCAGCQKPITGRCITAMFRKFHPEHFTCAFCLKQLNKGTFKEQNDKPYCHPCFVKLFG